MKDSAQSLDLHNLIHEALMRGDVRLNVGKVIKEHAQQLGVLPPSEASIAAAYPQVIDSWLEAANETDALFFARHMAKLDDLYKLSYTDEDYKTCNAILAAKLKARDSYNSAVEDPRREPARRERIRRLRDRKANLRSV